jgi:hypothetical protein
MVDRRQHGWVRAAALGLLTAWLPCMPLGLCLPAPEKATRHGCCPRQAPVKVSAAPQECWLQAPAPLPAGPTPPTTAALVALTAHTRPVAQTAVMQDPRSTSFSPHATVLRI